MLAEERLTEIQGILPDYSITVLFTGYLRAIQNLHLICTPIISELSGDDQGLSRSINSSQRTIHFEHDINTNYFEHDINTNYFASLENYYQFALILKIVLK